jgi:hypothetical protein
MKKYLTLRVEGTEYHLRLTLGGQKRLKNRFAEDTLQTVLAAAADGEAMAAVLEEALHWEGSGNPELSGEAFYDLLVDSGYTGQEGFGGLAFDLAACSGLISQPQAELLKKTLHQAVNDAFAQLGEELAQQDPTQREA